MMKLSETLAKLTRNVKNHTLAIGGTAVLAGAVLFAAAPAAQAQHVRFGVTIGAPGYYAPQYGYGYYHRPYWDGYRGYYGHPYYGRGYYGRGWRR